MFVWGESRVRKGLLNGVGAEEGGSPLILKVLSASSPRKSPSLTALD